MVNSSEFCPTMRLKPLKAIDHVKSFLVIAIIALVVLRALVALRSGWSTSWAVTKDVDEEVVRGAVPVGVE